jgi:hypothetical protein
MGKKIEFKDKSDCFRGDICVSLPDEDNIYHLCNECKNYSLFEYKQGTINKDLLDFFDKLEKKFDGKIVHCHIKKEKNCNHKDKNGNSTFKNCSGQVGCYCTQCFEHKI